MANWGWGLGLLVPPFGLVLGILLTRRGDRRGPLIMIWSLVVPVVVALILVLG